MDPNVKVVFFDLGGTLRLCHSYPSHEAKAKKKLAELSGLEMTPAELFDLIELRYKDYRKEIFATNREANDFTLWNKWLLPEMDPDHLMDVRHEMSFWYRQCAGLRCMTEGALEVLQILHSRGYTLGIISNLIGETEIANFVKDCCLDRYFDDIVVSSVCGYRKPDPIMYTYACERLGVKPENCVSVADNLDRDITGAKAAGIYKNVLFISKEKLAKKTITDENRPDYIIHDMVDLLNLPLFD